MGAVYEATQFGAEGFQKQVAIKTIVETLGSLSDFVTMFIGEAKLVADLVHENIVQIRDFGMTEDDIKASFADYRARFIESRPG